MKELNLEVGQKVWTIQSGYCELIEIDKDAQYCFITENKDGRRHCYDIFGRYGDSDANPSLFESNPFEEKANLDGLREVYGLKESTLENVPEPENKAELINALRLIYKDCFDTDIKIVAKDKLRKLLESL